MNPRRPTGRAALAKTQDAKRAENPFPLPCRRFIELSVSSPVITPMVSVNAPDVSRLRSNVPVEEDSLEIDEIEDMPGGLCAGLGTRGRGDGLPSPGVAGLSRLCAADINMSRGETHKQGTWETRLAQRGKPSQDSSFIPKTRTAEEIKQKYGKSSSAQVRIPSLSPPLRASGDLRLGRSRRRGAGRISP